MEHTRCIDFVRQSDARERIFGAFDGAAGRGLRFAFLSRTNIRPASFRPHQGRREGRDYCRQAGARCNLAVEITHALVFIVFSGCATLELVLRRRLKPTCAASSGASRPGSTRQWPRWPRSLLAAGMSQSMERSRAS